MKRVALVGAGYIAGWHIQALRTLKDVRITAIVDPIKSQAERRAKAAGGVAVFSSLEDLLAADMCDVAHVLVPPPAHAEVAAPLLHAGISVFAEKPLAATVEECRTLVAAAERSGATLAVNHNYLFHPAFVRLLGRLNSGAIGRVRSVACIYNVPLRQLTSRQLGHWMFDQPTNLLLEQAVHPLSLIAAIIGPIRDMTSLAEAPTFPVTGLPVYRSLTTTMSGERGLATLQFAVGQTFPCWQVAVVGDDGVLVADLVGNRQYAHQRTRFLPPIDNALSSLATASRIGGDGVLRLLDYSLSMVRLKPPTDPFLISIRDSIAAFYRSLEGGRKAQSDGRFGADLVELCHRMGQQAFGSVAPVARPVRTKGPERWDVTLLGGTGFIGTETVRRLVARGLSVAVMARNVRNLPDVFDDPQVAVVLGDIRDAQAIERAIGQADVVVNLAHGGGGEDYRSIRAAMVEGAETVARLCLAKRVRRFIHLSSIAALYLGPTAGTVTGQTPPDPRAEERSDYARAKAEAERLLLEMARRDGLPLVILRPGLVVGAGTAPFHSGLGFANNEQHCIGWNLGRNPLPFVLVGDVADAIVAAISAEIPAGSCYNLVGDVRLSAREFIAELAEATGRPLRFHPSHPLLLWSVEVVKWAIKRLGGKSAPWPSRRDLLSRGLVAQFDCSDAKRDLGWRPVADRDTFVREAIAVHGR